MSAIGKTLLTIFVAAVFAYGFVIALFKLLIYIDGRVG